MLTENSIITRKFWNLFKKNHVTTFGCVPYIFEILKKIKFEKMFLPSLKYITQAGGKLDENLVDEDSGGGILLETDERIEHEEIRIFHVQNEQLTATDFMGSQIQNFRWSYCR